MSEDGTIALAESDVRETIDDIRRPLDADKAVVGDRGVLDEFEGMSDIPDDADIAGQDAEVEGFMELATLPWTEWDESSKDFGKMFLPEVLCRSVVVRVFVMYVRSCMSTSVDGRCQSEAARVHGFRGRQENGSRSIRIYCYMHQCHRVVIAANSPEHKAIMNWVLQGHYMGHDKKHQGKHCEMWRGLVTERRTSKWRKMRAHADYSLCLCHCLVLVYSPLFGKLKLIHDGSNQFQSVQQAKSCRQQPTQSGQQSQHCC